MVLTSERFICRSFALSENKYEFDFVVLIEEGVVCLQVS